MNLRIDTSSHSDYSFDDIEENELFNDILNGQSRSFFSHTEPSGLNIRFKILLDTIPPECSYTRQFITHVGNQEVCEYLSESSVDNYLRQCYLMLPFEKFITKHFGNIDHQRISSGWSKKQGASIFVGSNDLYYHDKPLVIELPDGDITDEYRILLHHFPEMFPLTNLSEN